MNADSKRRGLGRGLSALLGDEDETAAPAAREDPAKAPHTVPIEHLRPSRFQPRRHMDPEALQELAQSIAAKGLLQPILVRRVPDEADAYEIIAGERRWRAAQLAQLHDVPVLVRELSDRDAQEVALVENLQRQDLSALEEAEGYRRLMQEYEHTQEDLAGAVGKSRSHVANMMRLLGLPEPVKEMLEQGRLTAGHARALLATDEPEALARAVVENGLNVRQTEALAARKPEPPAVRRGPGKDADTLALEREMSGLLGLPVEIRFRGSGGALILHYTTLDQLDDILSRLSRGARGRSVPSAAE